MITSRYTVSNGINRAQSDLDPESCQAREERLTPQSQKAHFVVTHYKPKPHLELDSIRCTS